MDVAEAIRGRTLEAAAGQIGQPPAPSGQAFQMPIDTLGRLVDPEQFGDDHRQGGAGDVAQPGSVLGRSRSGRAEHANPRPARLLGFIGAGGDRRYGSQPGQPAGNRLRDRGGWRDRSLVDRRLGDIGLDLPSTPVSPPCPCRGSGPSADPGRRAPPRPPRPSRRAVPRRVPRRRDDQRRRDHRGRRDCRRRRDHVGRRHDFGGSADQESHGPAAYE